MSTRAIGTIASVATRSARPSQLASLISLFEFGPKTGEVVFDDTFADDVAERDPRGCPSRPRDGAA